MVRDAGRIGRRAGLRGYVETITMVAGVTVVAIVSQPVLPATAADLLYLVPVLAAASLYGLGPGIAAAGLGAAAYNFFFTPPYHTLRMSEPGDAVTVIVFLGVALFTSRMAAKLRERAAEAATRAEQATALASFAQALLGTAREEEAASAICTEARRLFRANACLVEPGMGSIGVLASTPPLDRIAGFDAVAAERAMEEGRPAGRGTGAIQAADWTFYPLASAQGGAKALGLARDDGLPPVAPERHSLLDTVLAHGALALERHRLAGEVTDLDRLRERERLRDALLSSVGHDLRTPLTAILAAAGELRRGNGGDGELVATLDAEAHRLDRYVTNLLGMARIEAGSIRLGNEPVDLTDAVAAAVRDLRRQSGASRISVLVPADLPLVRLDPQLLHHCIINLVDNATRHGGERVEIEITGRRTGCGVEVAVLDTGPGLPSGREARLFETFARIEGSDRTGGAGLGLAIVKGFADAMEVTVAAGNRENQRGARFGLFFPERLLVDEGSGEPAG